MKGGPLRIAHIVTPLGWRGGEVQAVYLYEELQKLGAEQLLICSKGSQTEDYCRTHNFRYRAVKRRFSLNPLYAREIARICREEQIDLMDAHDSGAHTFAVLSKDLFKNPAKLILHRRVDFPVSRSIFSRYKYNHASLERIICVSKAIKKILEPDIRNPGKIRVIYDGIDLQRFKVPPGKKLRTELNIPSGRSLIANIAAISQQKDYFTFADTVRILVDKGVDATFLAIGDGPDREKIKAYVSSLNLSKHIHFTGFRDDIPEILPELDVLLFTSETEGLGTTILDAYVCGVAVVTTDAGGIPEIMEHDQTGYMAPVKNPEALAQGVLLAINDPERKSFWIENARKRVQHFSKENTAKQTLALYKECTE